MKEDKNFITGRYTQVRQLPTFNRIIYTMPEPVKYIYPKHLSFKYAARIAASLLTTITGAAIAVLLALIHPMFIMLAFPLGVTTCLLSSTIWLYTSKWTEPTIG